jgi:hypothetical protein
MLRPVCVLSACFRQFILEIGGRFSEETPLILMVSAEGLEPSTP